MPALSLRRLALPLLLLVSLLPSPARAGGEEEFFARVVLNRQEKGEMLLRRDDGGRFLLREADWDVLGISSPRRTVTGGDGETLVPLAEVEGVRVAFDENTVTLEIVAEPSSFPVNVRSLRAVRRGKVLRSDEDSAFLNYGAIHTGGSGGAVSTTVFPNELGVRRRGWLFLNGGSYETGGGGNRYRRFATSATRDDREKLTRLVLGDGTAASGDLGSAFTMAGVSYGRDYRMDPYLERYPTAGIRGSTLYPAEVSVYVDNVHVATERVPSGPYEIRDLSYYGGAGEVRFVLRDVFGREEEIRTPFYFTDAVLRKSFHEYAWHAGAFREGSGDGLGGYSKPALSFFHRYGVSERLTAGVRGEAAGSRFNAGGSAAAKVGRLGVLAGALAAGSDGEGGGAAALLSYAYQDRRFSLRTAVEIRTARYGTAGETAGEGIRSRLSMGAGYVGRRYGSLSLDYHSVSRHGGPGQSTLSVSASRTFRRWWTVQGGYRRQGGSVSEGEAFLFLTRRFPGDRSASVRVAAGDGGNRQELDGRKYVPLGEGYGYGLHVERADRDEGGSVSVSPSGQYNGRYGVLSGDLTSRTGTPEGETYRAGLSGSVLRAGGEFHLSRPVTDSFGVASLPGLPGVRVFQNGQEVGRTDRKGRVLLPNLASWYENQVSVEDREIPIEYRIGEITQYVSPPFRSGILVPFDVRRLQAVTGRIDIITLQGVVPAEYAEGTLTVTKEAFVTGRGGEFYLENLPAGVHEGTIAVGGRECRFRLEVAPSEEFMLDLGRIACEPAP